MLELPEEIDGLLNWRLGRAERLARRNKLPHYLLPDGSIRFRREEILALITPSGPLPDSGVILADIPVKTGGAA